MRFFATGIAITAAFRNFSTKGSSKYPKYKKTTETRKPEPEIQWTEEQKSVLSAVTQGSSVFITGSAGTGKTRLLLEVVKLLNLHKTKSSVFVTAYTGVAAVDIKGQTLHSFAGINYPSRVYEPQMLLDQIRGNKVASLRWKKVETLVIDEISMVDPTLFDSLEFVARNMKGVDEKWGGIQLVAVGDFCQLAPVSEPVKYAFEAVCWNVSFDLQIELTRIYRQSDPRFIKLLQSVRMGEMDVEELSFLEKHCSEAEPDSSVVQLYPLNKYVKKVNEEKLRSLPRRVVWFRAVDGGNGKDSWKRRQWGVPDVIPICAGARVMLIRNVKTWKGLVNGATGTVIKFEKTRDVINDTDCEKLLPVVKFDSGKFEVIKPEEWHVMNGDEVVAWRKQIPLRLAWAISIHRCQGMTLDKAYINLDGAFGYGMVYTALSRVRSLDGLHLSGFMPSQIRAHDKVKEFYRNLALKRDNMIA